MCQLLSPLVKDPRWSKIRFTLTDDIGKSVTEADLQLFEYPLLSSDSNCFLQFTSGSTAQPKGVVVTHGSLLHNVHTCTKGFNFPYWIDGPGGIPCKGLDEFPLFEGFHFWKARHESSEAVLGHRVRIFSWLPVYHDMGLIGFVCAPLLFGAALVQMSPLDFIRRPYVWLKGISDFQCLCTAAPNFAYEIVCNKMTEDVYNKLDLSRVAGWLCGAEPIRASTLDKFLSVIETKCMPVCVALGVNCTASTLFYEISAT